MKGAIFDLDGVIVDTAKYHYLAWKELADSLGFVFTEQHNERLKGVSRIRSLEILLEIGNLSVDDKEKAKLLTRKNERYVHMLDNIDSSHLLKGAEEYLIYLKEKGIKISLASASKNAPLIINKLGITKYFDALIDGNQVVNTKPDPEVFIKAAEKLGLDAKDCTVFEDSQAGIDAAKKIGCKTVAIGTPDMLKGADIYVSCLGNLLP